MTTTYPAPVDRGAGYFPWRAAIAECAVIGVAGAKWVEAR